MSNLDNPADHEDDSSKNDSQTPSRRIPKRRLLARILAWYTTVSTLIAVVGAIAIAILLHNQRFHDYLLRTLEDRASSSLGVRVTIQNFALNLSALNVDLYGLTVDGAAPYQQPALLQVEHAQAGVRIVSLLRRQWYFDSIRIDHPIVQIKVDAKGVSNLPTFKSSGSGSSSTDAIFDFGIRHAILDHGEAYYNDRPSQLAADLHDLEFHAAFDNLLQKYTGHLAYSGGQIAYGGLRPVQHNLDADFNATRTAFNLSQARITSGKSQINLVAVLNNYVSPVVDGKYDITLDGAQIGQILHTASLPSGLLHTTGSVSYRQTVGSSFLDSLAMNGDLASAKLDVRAAQARAAIERIAGHYSLANGVVTIGDLRAKLLGGDMNASGSLGLSGQTPHSTIHASLRGISLADLSQASGRNAQTGNARITGRLNADAKASCGKTIDDLIANVDATIDGQIAGATQVKPAQTNLNSAQTSSESSSVPLNSALHAKYTAKDQQLALSDSYLRTPQTNIAMSGAVSRNSNLNVRLQANDLREVEALAELFIPSSSDRPAPQLGLAGVASFQGVVRGSVTAPHLTGLFSATNLHVYGSEWKLVRTNVDASPSSVSLQHAGLELASRGRIAFDASSELQNWKFANTGNVQVNLQASQLDLAEIAKLAGRQFPVTGTLAANVTMHGTVQNPIGSGSVQLKNANAYGQPIESVQLNFTGAGADLHAELSAVTSAGSVSAKASVRSKDKTYSAELSSSGIDLAKVELLKQKNVNATGVVRLNANGQGSFDNPQAKASIYIPTLVVQNQTISAIDLEANIADHFANATLTSKAVNTSVQGKANVALTGDYQADASLDTEQIPLQPLFAIYAPDSAEDLSGQTEIHATLHGPLKNRNLLEAHVTVPLLKLAYGSQIQLSAASPIHLDYKNGVFDLQRAAIRGTGTDVVFQGSIPVSGNGSASLLMQGSVNLELAQLFDPDVRSSGQLKLNINSNGPMSAADIGGEIDIVDANFASATTPVALSHGNGVLKVTKDRINIASFSGTLGGGDVTAQGGVAYRPKVQFDLGAIAQGVRILYPQGMRERIDANIRLTGSPETAVLGGNVSLSDLSFTPAFDLTSFINQFSGEAAAPPARGFSQNLRLNLAVDSTSDVNLISRTLSVGGSANLQVRGTAADPVILGRVNLSSGDIILNGSRFVLNGGTVQFINPAETQPVLNLALGTTIQQYNITLRFQGPVDQLKTQYTSDPSLPAADIINLLAFGQTTEASAANPATPTDQAAQSLVASQVSSQVTSRVSKIAGISQLSISPVLAGSSTQGPPGANITIQQRVTGNLFVTFSTNVASTQSQTIQGQYQISPRVAVSATRDPNGGFAFDTLIKKTW